MTGPPDKSALSVQPGVPQPAAPRLQRTRRKLTREQFIEGVLAGDRAVLGQAITLIESTRPEDGDLAQDVLEGCLPSAGSSIRVGITGVPGVGKSTLIEVLGKYLTGDRGERVAVLAVDPSSTISHGSILGDKTRMAALAVDDMAFIRPSPTAGSLGGVARRTRETLLLCEAAGYRNVIIETVGVGQSETTVRSMVDFFLLLMLAGAGDELQGMKRGIMEMTDLVAINKADGNNRDKAQMARREYEHALHFFPAAVSGWNPQVITCSGQTREGISDIWNKVLEHNAWMREHGLFDANRREQARSWMYESLEYGLREQFHNDPLVRGALPALEADVLEGRVSSYRAARRLLDLYKKSNS